MDRTLYKPYRLPDEMRERLDELYAAQQRMEDRVFGSPEFQEMWYLSQITGRRINIEVVQPEGGVARVEMTLEESAPTALPLRSAPSSGCSAASFA